MPLMITFREIQDAAARIEPHVRFTPVLESKALNQRFDAEVYLKAEHLQEVGAFKARGACNAVFSLADEDAERGVVTHSSGNHAAALARAAARRGIPAYIVMPENAPKTKVVNVRQYGANITFCPPTLEARESYAARVQNETGATFIHPYDDDRIIAGQGTAALELLTTKPDLDLVIAPVGGGGLLAGTLIAAKEMQPGVEVWAAEPEGADDAYRSWKSGQLIEQTNPQTIADGLRTSVGQRNFEVMQSLLDDLLLASESTIRKMVEVVWEAENWPIEPSAAVPLAALEDQASNISGRRVGIIVSGGNLVLSQFLAEVH